MSIYSRIKFETGRLSGMIYNLIYRRRGCSINGVLINCHIDIEGEGNRIIIEKGVVLRNVSISIKGTDNVLTIKSGSEISESGRVRMEDTGGEIVIGKNLRASDMFLTTADDHSRIEIGDDCLVSAKVIVRTSDSHSIIDDTTGERINPPKDVRIGNRVWIGYGVTIMKGTVIGDDSVIGTNALVAGINVPPHSLVAGMPARVIKNNISWNAQRLKT
ncbi:MAG: acyltransferase [Duncaniella sp.]|nr:acyltransferase [Duncaniella sp.]